MRIDIVTIFPAYFDVLAVSLLGRARDVGLLDIRVHDLRNAAADRHRTTDDTPYGGGAGMVMTPEPWGVTLDALLAEPAQPPPVLVFPSPAGYPFRQATARDLADRERLIFGCGRYEGIDERVVTHYATRTDTRCLSLGDFVLNGGEVAALAMIEAIARLIPGVLGNPASIVEESHEDGLLEYPVYTKPSEWRGLLVPEVLRSGNHAAVAQWRRAEQLRRTQITRPDLLDPNAPRH